MLKKNCFPSLILVLFLFGSPLSAEAASTSGPLSKDVTWKGEVVLAGPVTVPAGVTLTIAAGTRVRPVDAAARLVVQGILLVRGTAAAPVVFAAVEKWQGIEFVEAPPGCVIEQARFSKAQAALSSIATDLTVRGSTFVDCAAAIKLLRESHSLIEDCRFVGNEMGIENEMKSTPVIRRNHFEGHKNTAIFASHNSSGAIVDNLFFKNKQGITLMQKYPDRIEKNRFVENGVGIFCNQTQNTPTILGNTFEKNENALVNFSFSYPVVEDNRFFDNETAIRNDQFGSPRVARNLLRGNRTALYNNRKSNPDVQFNHIEKNGLALFVDYSSYPRVSQNNFLDNERGVELGIYQSADWEKRSGSSKLVQKEALSRKSQNPLLAKAPTVFSDYVDVSGNWWGKDTAQMVAVGTEGNLTIFFDRYDKPEVTYEGFGPDSYRLDRVVYSPWLEAPVAEAGPGGTP
jgi:hypothetical protein